MSLTLYAHPFSSYCQKVLVALYENATPFTYRQLGPEDPEAGAEWVRLWPLKKMPVLVDGAAPVFESVLIGSQRASSVAAQVTGMPWHAIPAAAVGYETGLLTPTTKTFASETGNVGYFYGLTALPTATAAASTDLVTSTAHGLAVGQSTSSLSQ